MPFPALQAIEQQRPDLEQLFRDAAEDLLRYFTRRHGQGETPRDLVQETFVEMAKGLEKGRAPESPRGYLFGIARHVSQAAWKKRDRERKFTTGDVEAAEQPGPVPDERIAAAREVIATMPDLQREVLELRFSQDLSYAEIAEALDIPIGTVRSRLHNAVAGVRERLAEDGIGDG